MMGEHRHNARVIGVVVGSTILITAAQTAIDEGLIEGLAVILSAFLLIVAVSYIAVVATGWIGYAAGFHRRDNLSGWRVALAFFLIPVGVFALPVVQFLSLRPLVPIVPGPMAEEIKDELAGDGRGSR